MKPAAGAGASGGGAPDAEARQKRLLLGLSAFILLIGCVAGIVLFAGGSSGGKGPPAAAAADDPAERVDDPAPPVGPTDAEKAAADADGGAEGAADFEPAGTVDGLGEDWEARLAKAGEVVDGFRLRLAEDPDLNEDSVASRIISKARAKFSEAKLEARGGDPARARRAVAETIGEKAALEAYLAAKEEVRESVEAYEAARSEAAELRLQVFEKEIFMRAVEARQAAEKSTAEGEAEAAAESYAEAVAFFDEAKASFEASVARAREMAAEAIHKGDKAAAEAAVADLLERLPEDEAGRVMRERVTVLDETHPLYAQALDNERNGLWAIAEGRYRSILEKDPHHREAETALARVVAERTKLVVAEKLEEAGTLSESGETVAALEAARAALALDPAGEAAKRMVADLEAAAEDERIRSDLAAAAKLEAEGDYEAAAELYDALAADFPGVAKAREGRERALSAARDAAQAERLLKAAREGFERGSVADLERAVELAEEARRLNPAKDAAPVLIAAVRERLKLMNEPVPVTLVSDGETRIEVWQVGVFEDVKKKTIHLKPGSYTVVGKRRYYFDVRKDLSVQPGAENLEFTVKCEDPI